MGGCIVKSSHHAGGLCLQVKPRERKKKKKKRKRESNTKGYHDKTNFQDRRQEAPSRINPANKKAKTEGTCLPTHSTITAEEEKGSNKKEQHSVLFLIQNKAQLETLGGQQILNLEFSNQHPEPKRTFRNKQTTRRINRSRDKEKKTSSILCYL